MYSPFENNLNVYICVTMHSLVMSPFSRDLRTKNASTPIKVFTVLKYYMCSIYTVPGFSAWFLDGT